MNGGRKVYGVVLLLALVLLAAACTPDAQEADNFAVELRWSGSADLDLMVTIPDGQRITYANPQAGGGTLVADAQAFCSGEGLGVERVAFPDGAASQGEYYVTVSYSLPCGAAEPVDWELTVRNGDEVIQRSGQLLPGESAPVGRFLHG